MIDLGAWFSEKRGIPDEDSTPPPDFDDPGYQ